MTPFRQKTAPRRAWESVGRLLLSKSAATRRASGRFEAADARSRKPNAWIDCETRVTIRASEASDSSKPGANFPEHGQPAVRFKKATGRVETNMQIHLIKAIEEMQRQAKVCATVAQDKTEEALTGASCDKERNIQDAKAWMLRSQVWLEAEAVVRGFALPLDQPVPCI